MEEVLNFIGIVNTKRVCLLKKDRMIWKLIKDGKFSVKSSFDNLERGSQQNMPLKVVWNLYIPSKVGFFGWEVWWGKNLTMEQLKRRGYPLANSPFCRKAEEMLEHLLIHFPKIWGVWSVMGSLL